MVKVKVLVVDDSAFMRKMIGDLLENDPNITVIARARNGKEALEKIKLYDPDVITLDVEMPEMNGLEALENIMNRFPKPVIMLSSTTKEGTETTIRAMEMGAFDFITKPSGSISLDIHKVRDDLVRKVLLAYKTPTLKLIGQNTRAVVCQKDHNNLQKKYMDTIPGKKVSQKAFVLIGTSTGGPKALQNVLSTLPADFSLPILVVQHMPVGFTRSLSERLNSLCKITVKEAEHGEVIKKGVAYIAPGGYHLTVRKVGFSIAVELEQSELISGHRPSVDAMFNSFAKLPSQDIIAVLLTGMGTDGTKGLLKLKEKHRTVAIAESRETAVVYGMPKSAIQTNKVDIEASLEDISTIITRLCD